MCLPFRGSSGVSRRLNDIAVFFLIGTDGNYSAALRLNPINQGSIVELWKHVLGDV